MRIGIDIRLRKESGVGRYIRNLVKNLKKIDKKNKYILISPKFRWHSIKEQLYMPFFLKKKKPDIVHFPYFNVPYFYRGKFVVTIHDLIIDHFETGKASTLNPFFYRFKRLSYCLIMKNALYQAEKIIVPSNATKSEVIEHYNVKPEKVEVIYEGRDRKIKYQKSNIKNTNKDSKILRTLKVKNYFLYVGNAYPHKNLERLIKAFQRLKTYTADKSSYRARQSLKLVLAGKEDFFYQRLKRLSIEKGLENEIIFTGYVDDNELSWLYENAIALVLPSLMEGFGLPVLEAMQNKCLVLSSDIPALREICQKSAVYFNPYNIEELTKKMNKILINHDTLMYNNKVQIGLKRVKIFSWKKMAKKTLKVYENCFSL